MSTIFRDPTDGATARRADLLRRRRDELVMMPHAIRRVYVARRARTAASIAVAALGTALLAVAMNPAWAQFLATGMPGINPAVLCTFVVAMWIVGAFTYLAARALDEHRFAVAMSRMVMPGVDLHADLERLAHEHPDQAAREMAHRLEVRSAALPVLAAGMLLPVTVLYIGAAIRAGGWPAIADFEAMVALHAKQLALCAGIGALTAVAMTKRAARVPFAAQVAAAIAFAGAGIAVATTLWLVPIALIVATVALVGRRLRIERELLEAEDPAVGGELFTLRGFIRQLRASLAPVVARVRGVKPVWVLVGGLLAIAGYTGLRLVEVERVSKVQTYTAAAAPEPVQVADLGPTGSRATTQPMGDGRILVELDLVDGEPLDIPALAGLSNVPMGWSARVTIQQVEGLSLEVSAFLDDATQRVSIGDDVTMTRSTCGMGPLPLGLRVRGAPGHYVLYIEPVLTPTSC